MTNSTPVVALVVLACSGCITDMLDLTDTSWNSYCERNRVNLTKLSLGMTMQEVEEIMGTGRFGDPTNTPHSVETEPLEGDDGEVMFVTRWLYVTRPEGRLYPREMTAVVFNSNGQLIGWKAR